MSRCPPGCGPTDSTDVAWLDEIQQPPQTVLRRAPVLPSLLVDEEGRAIRSRADWERRRLVLRRQWLDFLGPLETTRREPPSFEVVEEDRLDGVARMRIRYETEPGCPVEAYLLKPLEIRSPRPGVVVFHSTVPYTIRQPAGLEGQPEKAFGLSLAQQGCVALCPRCYLWPGESNGRFRRHVSRQVRWLRTRHPRARGMAKLLHDAQVALDLLAHLPEVDPQRLGAAGHSLGAKEVLYLSALDERVRVAVSSEGGIGRKFSNWNAPWYLGRSFFRPSPREHHELLALASPRAFLLVGGGSADGDHSWPFVAAALPVYRLYEETPRLGLFNHRQGHTVPASAQRRVNEWFTAYL